MSQTQAIAAMWGQSRAEEAAAHLALLVVPRGPRKGAVVEAPRAAPAAVLVAALAVLILAVASVAVTLAVLVLAVTLAVASVAVFLAAVILAAAIQDVPAELPTARTAPPRRARAIVAAAVLTLALAAPL